MARRSSTTQSDSQVAARAQLEASDNDPTADLEQQATEQEAQQAEELKAGKAAGKAADGVEQKFIDEGNVAAARRSAGFSGNGPQAGFIDQISRRSGNDPMEGHFVTIDLSADGVEDAYKATQGLYDEEADEIRGGNYGVYESPASLDENGYPVTVNVRLRGDTVALVAVPYEALSPSEAGHR